MNDEYTSRKAHSRKCNLILLNTPRFKKISSQIDEDWDWVDHDKIDLYVYMNDEWMRPHATCMKIEDAHPESWKAPCQQ